MTGWKRPASGRRGRSRFATRRLPRRRDTIAPDGSDVRILLALGGGSMAHFELAPGHASVAVAHRTVEEIWFILGGRGEMWRRQGTRENLVRVEAGLCLAILLLMLHGRRAGLNRG